MIDNVLWFWLVHLVIGLMIPYMVFCDRCWQESQNEDTTQEE